MSFLIPVSLRRPILGSHYGTARIFSASPSQMTGVILSTSSICGRSRIIRIYWEPSLFWWTPAVLPAFQRWMRHQLCISVAVVQLRCVCGVNSSLSISTIPRQTIARRGKYETFRSRNLAMSR